MSEPAEDYESSPGPSGNWVLWGVAVCVAILVGVGVFGKRGVLRAYQVQQQKLALEDEIRGLRQEGQALRHEISRLHNDKGYIAQLARTELGMVRDNEIVSQFPATH